MEGVGDKLKVPFLLVVGEADRVVEFDLKVGGCEEKSIILQRGYFG